MPDLTPVPFSGGPAESGGIAGGSVESLDSALAPDNLPPASAETFSDPAPLDSTPALDPPAPAEEVLHFGEELGEFDDGSHVNSIDAAADWLASQADSPPPEDNGQAPPGEIVPPAETEQPDSSDFFEMLAADPEIGSTAHQIRDKYGNDPMAAMRGLVNAQTRLAQRDEFASVGRAVKEDPEYAKHVLGLNQPVQAPQETNQAFEQRATEWNDYQQKVWGNPEYDPKWEDQYTVEYNEAGEATGAVPKEGAPKDVVQKLQRWQEFKARKLDEIMQNPAEALSGMILPVVDQLVQQRTQEALRANTTQTQSQAQASAFKDRHSNWLYANQRGPQDSSNLTQSGQVFYQGLDEAAKKGLQNPQDQIDWATYRLEMATRAAVPQGSPQQPPQAAPPQQPNAQRASATASASGVPQRQKPGDSFYKKGDNIEARLLANLRNPELYN